MAFTVTSSMTFLNSETVSTTGVLVFNSTGNAARKFSVKVGSGSAAPLLIQVSPLHAITSPSAMTSANSVMMAASDTNEFISSYDLAPIDQVQVRGAGGIATFSMNRTG